MSIVEKLTGMFPSSLSGGTIRIAERFKLKRTPMEQDIYNCTAGAIEAVYEKGLDDIDGVFEYYKSEKLAIVFIYGVPGPYIKGMEQKNDYFMTRFSRTGKTVISVFIDKIAKSESSHKVFYEMSMMFELILDSEGITAQFGTSTVYKPYTICCNSNKTVAALLAMYSLNDASIGFFEELTTGFEIDFGKDKFNEELYNKGIDNVRGAFAHSIADPCSPLDLYTIIENGGVEFIAASYLVVSLLARWELRKEIS